VDAAMEEITTVGLELSKNVFQVHGSNSDDEFCCARNYDESNCCHSSPNSLLAPWRWKRVPAVIIGAERLALWGKQFD
jgi:hypothetical protein